METLGPYLRSAREAKGIDLREAAQQTRIHINFLKAIEEEDFVKLPGPVFVKGFLKSYARFLQLDEDEVMDRYAGLAARPAASGGQKSERQKPAAAQKQPEPEPEGRARTSWEPYLWSGIAVIAFAALLLIVVPGRHRPAEHQPAASQPTASAAMVTAPAATAVSEKLYLDIFALEDVWVLVRTDSSPQKQVMLKKGESVTWSADARFLVSYGSIGAVKLVLNGKELTVTGPKNAVVRDLIITAQGVAFQKFEAEKPKPAKPKVMTKPAATATQQPLQQPASPEQQTAPAPSLPRAESPQPAPKPPQQSFASPLESILPR